MVFSGRRREIAEVAFSIVLIVAAYYAGWQCSFHWHQNTRYVPNAAIPNASIPTGYAQDSIPGIRNADVAVGDRVDVFADSEAIVLDALVLSTKSPITLMVRVSDHLPIGDAINNNKEITIRRTLATGPPTYQIEASAEH